MQSLYFQQSFQRAFGTYPLTGEALSQALTTALEVGYRAIDTAQMYNNEADIGRCLQNITIDRSALCITTKVHPDNISAKRFLPSVAQSLKDLQVDYVDVLLLHWPPLDGQIEAGVQLLAEAQQRGLTRQIGVSNYNSALLRYASSLIDVPLVANQVEFHPLLDQSKLLSTANELGIPLTSYCSVARGEIFKYPLFQTLGDQYGRTAAQIALQWILQKGVAITTMSTQVANIQANFALLDFVLSSVDMAKIDALMATNYRIVTQALAPWAPTWD